MKHKIFSDFFWFGQFVEVVSFCSFGRSKQDLSRRFYRTRSSISYQDTVQMTYLGYTDQGIILFNIVFTLTCTKGQTTTLVSTGQSLLYLG